MMVPLLLREESLGRRRVWEDMFSSWREEEEEDDEEVDVLSATGSWMLGMLDITAAMGSCESGCGCGGPGLWGEGLR